MTRRRRLLLPLAALLACGAGEAEEPAEKQQGWQVSPFALTNRDSDFRIALQGYIQADFRSYRDWTAGDDETGSLRAEESEWRRLRIGIEGRWKRLRFEVDADPAFDAGDELKDAWVAVRLAREIQVRGGRMKLPVGPERLTSAAKTDFVERAAVVEALAPDRDWGVVLEGEIGRALEYQGGLFEGDGRGRTSRAGRTAAARLVLKPAGWLDLGGSFSQGDVVAAAAGPDLDPDPKGLDGAGLTGYRFLERTFVDGRRLRWGADARIQARSVSVWGEYLQAREERTGQGPTLEDLPDVRGEGWSVTATWLLTGEKKARTIRPRRSLFAGPGAVEVAVRYETLRFDDVANEGFEGFGSRAGNIRPAGFRAFLGGLSWWPSSFLRLMGDVVVERYDDALRAPEAGRQGNYVSLLARVQVHLP